MTLANSVRGRFRPEFVQGSITVLNTNPTGQAPPLSAVEVDVSDAAALLFQVSGVYTGAKAVQATIDGINWVTLSAAQVLRNEATGAYLPNVPSAQTGLYSLDVVGYTRVRLTALAAHTGAAVVAMFTAEEPIALALDGGLAMVSRAPGNDAAPTEVQLNSAASTNGTTVKASAGWVTSLLISNISASTRFFKLYDLATVPNPATDIPIAVIPVPANGFSNIPLGGPSGIYMNVGIGFTITGAAPDTDATNIGAGEVKVFMNYY